MAISVWITSIAIFEARLGLAVMPLGRRRRALEEAFAPVMADDLENRVLDLDPAAATAAATLATRNSKRFGDLDVLVVDPWEK